MREKFIITLVIDLVVIVLSIVAIAELDTNIGKLVLFISTGVFIVALFGISGAPNTIPKRFNKRAIAVVDVADKTIFYYTDRPNVTSPVMRIILTYQTEQGQSVTTKVFRAVRGGAIFSGTKIPIRYNEKKPRKVVFDTEPSLPYKSTRTSLSPAAQAIINKEARLKTFYRKIPLISLILTFLLFMIAFAIILFGDESRVTETIEYLLFVNIMGMVFSGAGLKSSPHEILAILCSIPIVLDVFLVIRCVLGY